MTPREWPAAYASPGVRSLGPPTVDGPLLGATDDPDLERLAERAERLVQVVRVGDLATTGGDDEVARLDAGRVRERSVLDATDQDPGTIREPHRPAQPARDVVRGDRDPEADPFRRLAATQGGDASLELVIGRQGEIEALADPVGVEADQCARRIDERPARRARREGSGVLDAPRDAPAAGTAERAGDRRDEPERDAR